MEAPPRPAEEFGGQQEPLAPGRVPGRFQRPALTGTRGVPSLYHEVLDDAVELGAIVVPTAAQLSKVLAGAGGVLPVQFQHEWAHPGNGNTDREWEWERHQE